MLGFMIVMNDTNDHHHHQQQQHREMTDILLQRNYELTAPPFVGIDSEWKTTAYGYHYYYYYNNNNNNNYYYYYYYK